MMNKKILFAVITTTILVSGMAVGLGIHFSISQKYSELADEYNALLKEFQDLESQYSILLADYNSQGWQYENLPKNYNELNEAYLDLQNEYNLLIGIRQDYCYQIKSMSLPNQYLVFTEAVRRYYLYDHYLSLASDTSTYWYQYARFCRDIVLHDSLADVNSQSDLEDTVFTTVSNAFIDCLKYGSGTPYLACKIMRDTIDIWHWGEDYYVPPLEYVDDYVQGCIDDIEYEYDSDFTNGEQSDFIKFSVETAFQTKGDCEDQAILCAAYLESCGFETALAIIHDAEHPNSPDGLFHGSLLVHIEDTSSYYDSYSAGLWSLGSYDSYDGHTWCWLDPTWNIPFGSNPSWLQHYRDNDITWDDFTLAFCDIDGAISL